VMRSQSVAVAVGIALDADGRVLLARISYGEQSYGPPGGRIEAGESPAAAVRREFKEETGLDVAVERLIGFYSFTDEDHEARAYAFLCAIIGGELRLPRDEISEVLWADPESLPEPADMVGPFAIADAQAQNWGVVREALPWKPR
jgi:8-oxo-dGTP diphosphatase